MRNFIITIFALVTLFLASCSTSGKPNTAGADSVSSVRAAIIYTCPMHPEVISDRPGKCPTCKMTLVEKREHAGPADSTSHDDHQH